jgi:hypothetical protein
MSGRAQDTISRSFMAVLLSPRGGGASGSITSIANPAFPDKKKRKGKKKSAGNSRVFIRQF